MVRWCHVKASGAFALENGELQKFAWELPTNEQVGYPFLVIISKVVLGSANPWSTSNHHSTVLNQLTPNG